MLKMLQLILNNIWQLAWISYIRTSVIKFLQNRNWDKEFIISLSEISSSGFVTLSLNIGDNIIIFIARIDFYIFHIYWEINVCLLRK